MKPVMATSGNDLYPMMKHWRMNSFISNGEVTTSRKNRAVKRETFPASLKFLFNCTIKIFFLVPFWIISVNDIEHALFHDCHLNFLRIQGRVIPCKSLNNFVKKGEPHKKVWSERKLKARPGTGCLIPGYKYGWPSRPGSFGSCTLGCKGPFKWWPGHYTIQGNCYSIYLFMLSAGLILVPFHKSSSPMNFLCFMFLKNEGVNPVTFLNWLDKWATLL